MSRKSLLIGAILLLVLIVIAALCVPSVLRSRMDARHRHASTGLKAICQAEADYRSNDPDGDDRNAFWADDVRGLFTIKGRNGKPIRLIELRIALADADPGLSPRMKGPPGRATWGHWYAAFNEYEGVPDFVNDTGHDYGRFAFACYPDKPGRTGEWVFVVSEENTIYKKRVEETGLSSGGGPRPIPFAMPQSTDQYTFPPPYDDD
jgi:hypothetical protein